MEEFKGAKAFCFLHVCGGDPIGYSIRYFLHMFSPRMWR